MLGSLLDKTLRLEMDNAIFRKLQDAILQPSRSKEWFGMAEQAINTIYALGEHPDTLCNDIIKSLTYRVFGGTRSGSASRSQTPNDMDEDGSNATPDVEATPRPQSTTTQRPRSSNDIGEAFELSQLLFVVGHVAIKQIVYLELVEREWKRQKDEKEKGMFVQTIKRYGLRPKPVLAEKAAKGESARNTKEGEELEQVAGNAEDEIGERIAVVRESELLYGSESLLAIFGPMIVHICGSPHKYKV